MEALRCLEEGVLDSAGDSDTGSLPGLGFAAASGGGGGVLRWAETEGLHVFTARCRALAPMLGAHGARFEPSPWLVALAMDAHGLARWRHETNSGGL